MKKNISTYMLRDVTMIPMNILLYNIVMRREARLTKQLKTHTYIENQLIPEDSSRLHKITYQYH